LSRISAIGKTPRTSICLADWVAEAGDMLKDEAREAIYGMPYVDWKQGQPNATPEQLARMAESVAKNAAGH
jgi:uncharacterized protein